MTLWALARRGRGLWGLALESGAGRLGERTGARNVKHLNINSKWHHDVAMRTTLSLDDSLVDALKEQARLLNLPFEQVVNDALRRGLTPNLGEERAVYRLKPIPGGFLPGVDALKLNQLNDELETEEFMGREAQ